MNIIQRIKKMLNMRFTFFEHGHYYSTIPNLNQQKSNVLYCYQDINIERNKQFEYLQKLSGYYNDIKLNDAKKEDSPFYFLNRFFSYSDAIICWCLIANERPNKIVEVGCGFSSVLMLEAIKYYNFNCDFYCIDIDFSRLDNLISGFDLQSFKKLNRKIETLDIEFFKDLESGDILFIDSSHVSKKGSELHFLLFKILPNLASGVIIHFHDIFKNFEYPQAWLDEGIFWNEQYLLRAFLQNNSEYKILIFNDYLENEYESWYKINMPNCLKVHEKYSVGDLKGKWIPNLRGQSLWLQKL